MRICTTNQGKVREFGGLLLPLGISLIPTMHHDVPELGITCAENALLKAKAYHDLYPQDWVLAEDSGLVVPYLNFLPGPWSARFAQKYEGWEGPKEKVDRANNLAVLRHLDRVPAHRRGAYFVANLVLVDPEGQVAFTSEQRSYGWVLWEPQGTNGFGYDPIFASPQSFGKSWASLDCGRKNLISHRAALTWDFLAWVCGTERQVR